MRFHRYDAAAGLLESSAMPAFDDRFSENDRWNIVNYLRAQFDQGNQFQVPDQGNVQSGEN